MMGKCLKIVTKHMKCLTVNLVGRAYNLMKMINLYQGIEKETFVNGRPLPILERVKPNG